MKKIFFYNIFIITIILILLEFSIRIFNLIELQGYDKNVFYQKDNISFHSPNIFLTVTGKKLKTDKNGFRIPLKNYKYNKKLENLLILGDSVSYGVFVEEKKTLAGSLRKKIDKNLFNASVIGHTTVSYNYLIKKYEEELPIENVLIFLCLNDIIDKEGVIKKEDLKYISHHRDDNIFIQFLRNKIFIDINLFLRNKSYLFNLLKSISTNNVKRYFDYITPYYQSNEYVNLYKNNIREIIEFSSLKKLNVKFVLLPYKYQIIKNCNSDLMAPQNVVQGVFNKLDYELFDLSKECCDKGQDEFFLNFDPMHLSPLGHAFVSELLLKKKIIN